MSDAIITVENLGKKYSIHHQKGERYTALRDVITAHAMSPVRALKEKFERRQGKTQNGSDSALSNSTFSLSTSKEDFWALKNVSFEVKQGEVVGIIGRNGAGKSTLLKILSRITEPTEGRVKLRGRVASLLEVGTGFHPELTGRENIYLNGAILGMHRVEIKKKFDEIVAFAETEKFLDTPVKRYSSGMYVRLAFAVAAHLEPEILVVDEVLAVGDLDFQKKCLGKMREVATGLGRTVLFVSHNLAAVTQLCERSVLLENGRIVVDGLTSEVVQRYTRPGEPAPVEGPLVLTKGIELNSLSVTPDPVVCGQTAKLCVNLTFYVAAILSELVILIYANDGQRIAILDCRDESWPLKVQNRTAVKTTVHVDSFSLVQGEYSLGLYFSSTVASGDSLDVSRITVVPTGEAVAHVAYAKEYIGRVYIRSYARSEIESL